MTRDGGDLSRALGNHVLRSQPTNKSPWHLGFCNRLGYGPDWISSKWPEWIDMRQWSNQPMKTGKHSLCWFILEHEYREKFHEKLYPLESSCLCVSNFDLFPPHIPMRSDDAWKKHACNVQGYLPLFFQLLKFTSRAWNYWDPCNKHHNVSCNVVDYFVLCRCFVSE